MASRMVPLFLWTFCGRSFLKEGILRDVEGPGGGGWGGAAGVPGVRAGRGRAGWAHIGWPDEGVRSGGKD